MNEANTGSGDKKSIAVNGIHLVARKGIKDQHATDIII